MTTFLGRLVAVVAMVQAASSGVVMQVVRREQVDWSHLAATWRVGTLMVGMVEVAVVVMVRLTGKMVMPIVMIMTTMIMILMTSFKSMVILMTKLMEIYNLQ